MAKYRQVSISVNLDKDKDISDILDELLSRGVTANKAFRILLRDHKDNDYKFRKEIERLKFLEEEYGGMDDDERD